MTDKLKGVHPTLVARVNHLQMAMTELGYPMIVTDGLRSESEQRALYAQGRTAPGLIVTQADGVTHRSNHQAHDDGYGHAVDMAFLDANGRPTWEEHLPWGLYGLAAQTLGLVWGGAWSTPDRPHVELREEKA